MLACFHVRLTALSCPNGLTLVSTMLSWTIEIINHKHKTQGVTNHNYPLLGWDSQSDSSFSPVAPDASSTYWISWTVSDKGQLKPSVWDTLQKLWAIVSHRHSMTTSGTLSQGGSLWQLVYRFRSPVVQHHCSTKETLSEYSWNSQESLESLLKKEFKYFWFGRFTCKLNCIFYGAKQPAVTWHVVKTCGPAAVELHGLIDILLAKPLLAQTWTKTVTNQHISKTGQKLKNAMQTMSTYIHYTYV